jgi:hypothetical protein
MKGVDLVPLGDIRLIRGAEQIVDAGGWFADAGMPSIGTTNSNPTRKKKISLTDFCCRRGVSVLDSVALIDPKRWRTLS